MDSSLIAGSSVDAALLGRARAVDRLRSKTGVIAAEAEAVMQYKQQARDKRKAALLGLRSSMAEVKDSIQGANARRAEQAAADAQRRAEEAKKILAAAGGSSSSSSNSSAQDRMYLNDNTCPQATRMRYGGSASLRRGWRLNGRGAPRLGRRGRRI